MAMHQMHAPIGRLMSRTFCCLCLAFLGALPYTFGSAFVATCVAAAYDLGRGLPHDPHAAFRWYRKAAMQGDALAADELGSMYFTGNGVVPDPRAAVFWWHRSAEMGNAEAQDSMGYAFCLGIGVRPDGREAQRWWTMARQDGKLNVAGVVRDTDCTGRPIARARFTPDI
jgi:TPR repeat protein